MNDKDFVGMFCCPVCKEPMGLLMDKQLKKTINRTQVIGPELCENCKKKFTEENQVVVYEADDKSNLIGRYLIVNFDAFKNINENTLKFIKEHRFILMLEHDFNNVWRNMHANKNKS